ncbi:hypothetical protein PIROE2DRAFT_18495 [Piromyces sp. E2]|nr:hypothetical protein PIROE2DRAFT_18495 [Piromyces sp. E2]|eukprot:OUM56760.1 hypothetical protein PIROE2DRAFT_18495 [Piromyces sp. E2]
MRLSFTSLFLLFLLVIQANASIASFFNDIYDNLQNQINLITEKNLKKDVSFGSSNGSKLDVYYNKKETSKSKPVVIFVHGGGWIMGDKNEISKIGSLLMRNNYVAVFPNYPLYPKGNFDDMVDDVYKTVNWTYKNISKYGGNKDRIILLGYSAGAHLSALTTVKATLKLKNKGVALSPLPKLEKLVLISGPYDFDDYDAVTKFLTGSDADNGIAERLVSLLVNSNDIGPTDILKRYASNSIKDFGVPKITFYYSDADTLIYESSANNLMKQIRRVSPNTLINYVFIQHRGFDHGTLINGARTEEKEKEQMFLDIVKM